MKIALVEIVRKWYMTTCTAPMILTLHFSHTILVIKLQQRFWCSMNVKWSGVKGGEGLIEKKDPIPYFLRRIIPAATFHFTFFCSSARLSFLVSGGTRQPLGESTQRKTFYFSFFFLSRWLFFLSAFFLHFLSYLKLVHRLVDFVIFSLERFFKSFFLLPLHHHPARQLQSSSQRKACQLSGYLRIFWVWQRAKPETIFFL